MARERRCGGTHANNSACAALRSIQARDTSPSRLVEAYASTMRARFASAERLSSAAPTSPVSALRTSMALTAAEQLKSSECKRSDFRFGVTSVR